MNWPALEAFFSGLLAAVAALDTREGRRDVVEEDKISLPDVCRWLEEATLCGRARAVPPQGLMHSKLTQEQIMNDSSQGGSGSQSKATPMTTDLTKFPFPGLENPHAETLTEALRAAPVDAGFVLITVKGARNAAYIATVRAFAQTVRDNAASTGVTNFTAYREIRHEELGGAVPFDQPIIAQALIDAEKQDAIRPEHFPTIKPALKMVDRNDLADWTLMIEYGSTDQALAAANDWRTGGEDLVALTRDSKSHFVGSFKNVMRYASVSLDANVIQFFNFFPGPGDRDALWAGWQEALPWFFEAGEFRSSFPLVALDPDQEILVVNYAHCDSVKHFFLGVAYDPNYLATVKSAYMDRGFTLPAPFFCKVVPV